jgi:FG-GAP repeat
MPTALAAHPVVAVTTARIFGGEATDVASLGLLDPRQGLASELLLVRGGAAPVRAGRFSVGVGASDVTAADVNQDGRDELVVTATQPLREVLSFDANGAVASRDTESAPPAVAAPHTDLPCALPPSVDAPLAVRFVTETSHKHRHALLLRRAPGSVDGRVELAVVPCATDTRGAFTA